MSDLILENLLQAVTLLAESNKEIAVKIQELSTVVTSLTDMTKEIGGYVSQLEREIERSRKEFPLFALVKDTYKDNNEILITCRAVNAYIKSTLSNFEFRENSFLKLAIDTTDHLLSIDSLSIVDVYNHPDKDAKSVLVADYANAALSVVPKQLHQLFIAFHQHEGKEEWETICTDPLYSSILPPFDDEEFKKVQNTLFTAFLYPHAIASQDRMNALAAKIGEYKNGQTDLHYVTRSMNESSITDLADHFRLNPKWKGKISRYNETALLVCTYFHPDGATGSFERDFVNNILEYDKETSI